MGLVSRGRGGVAAVAAVGTLAACGSSVADADSTGAVRTTRAVSGPATRFCAAVSANADAIRPLGSLAANGTLTADQLRSTVAAARASGADLIDTAPADIRPDVQRTVEALNLQLTALVAAGGDLRAAARDPAVAAQLGSPDLAAASQRVSGYVGQNCQRSR